MKYKCKIDDDFFIKGEWYDIKEIKLDSFKKNGVYYLYEEVGYKSFLNNLNLFYTNSELRELKLKRICGDDR